MIKVNTNLEMRALELHRNKLITDLRAADIAYSNSVNDFNICPVYIDRRKDIKSMGQACAVECGQCQGTGWVKREQPISNVNTAAGKRLVIKD